MKIETGVMVMKNGKAWGCIESGGHGYGSSYGWMDVESAPIHNPKYCKKPTDVTYERSPYIQELLTAKLVVVKRTTTVEIEEN